MILELEKKGYIVIASVSTSEAVEPLEARYNGYVKALVLDPFEVCARPRFPACVYLHSSTASDNPSLLTFAFRSLIPQIPHQRAR